MSVCGRAQPSPAAGRLSAETGSAPARRRAERRSSACVCSLSSSPARAGALREGRRRDKLRLPDEAKRGPLACPARPSRLVGRPLALGPRGVLSCGQGAKLRLPDEAKRHPTSAGTARVPGPPQPSVARGASCLVAHCGKAHRRVSAGCIVQCGSASRQPTIQPADGGLRRPGLRVSSTCIKRLRPSPLAASRTLTRKAA